MLLSIIILLTIHYDTVQILKKMIFNSSYLDELEYLCFNFDYELPMEFVYQKVFKYLNILLLQDPI